MSNLLTQKGEKEINTCTCGDCKPLKEAESEKTSFFFYSKFIAKNSPDASSSSTSMLIMCLACDTNYYQRLVTRQQ